MGSGEQEIRRLRSTQERCQVSLGGIVAENPPGLPAGAVRLHPVGQGSGQAVDADVGNRIARIARGEEGRPAAPRRGRLFRRHHGGGVARVLLQGVEADPPHRTLDIELVLKLVGNDGGVADDQQVIRHALRHGRPGDDAVPIQEGPLGILRLIALGTAVLAVPRGTTRLLAAQIQEWLQGLAQRREPLGGLALGEDHAPTGLGQIARIAEQAFGAGPCKDLEGRSLPGVDRGLPRQPGQLPGRRGWQGIGTGLGVEAAAVENRIAHGCLARGR